MPTEIFTGEDVTIGVNGANKRMLSIRVRVMAEKFAATPSDGLVIERGSGPLDASMTITGQDSENTSALSAAEAMDLVLSKAAPSSLSWTDKATTPVSKLPTNFWTLFPLSKWRADSVESGSGGPTDVGQWTMELTPNNNH